MRLWGTFVRKSHVALPSALAIPDAQLALTLGAEGPDAPITNAAVKFIGDLSLHALMTKWGIREKGKLGGARDAADDGPIDPEALAAQAREELSAWHESGRQLLLTENVCSRLSADEIRTFDGALDSMLAQWRRGLKDLLTPSA